MARKFGLHLFDIADMIFRGARLPADALLGDEDRGFHAIMENFQNERLVLGATAVGLGRRALQDTLKHVKNRKAFGGTLWDLQNTRLRLAMLAARQKAVTHARARHGNPNRQGRGHRTEVSMVKALAGETVQDIMRECLQLHGGAGQRGRQQHRAHDPRCAHPDHWRRRHRSDARGSRQTPHPGDIPMTAEQRVRVQAGDDHVATVTLGAGSRADALDGPMFDALIAAGERLREERSGTRVSYRPARDVASVPASTCRCWRT
jgi:hypothetical protein